MLPSVVSVPVVLPVVSWVPVVSVAFRSSVAAVVSRVVSVGAVVACVEGVVVPLVEGIISVVGVVVVPEPLRQPVKVEATRIKQRTAIMVFFIVISSCE